MNFAEKKHHESSLSLLFISFFTGFTAFNYYLIWQQWLMARPGLHFIDLRLAIVLFIIWFFLGYFIGEQMLPQITKSLMMAIFVLLELTTAVFAIFSKFIFYNWLLKGSFIQDLPTVQLVLLLFPVMILPCILMSSTNSLLSRIFDIPKTRGGNRQYLYYISGSVFSFFVSSKMHRHLMGFENAIYLGAFLNFSCAAIAAVHYYFTRTKKE